MPGSCFLHSKNCFMHQFRICFFFFTFRIGQSRKLFLKCMKQLPFIYPCTRCKKFLFFWWTKKSFIYLVHLRQPLPIYWSCYVPERKINSDSATLLLKCAHEIDAVWFFEWLFYVFIFIFKFLRSIKYVPVEICRNYVILNYVIILKGRKYLIV